MDSVVQHSYSVESRKLARKMSNLDKIIFYKKAEEGGEVEKKLNASKQNWGRNNSPKRYHSHHTHDGEEITDLGLLNMQPVIKIKKKTIDLSSIDEESYEGDITSGGNDIFIR